MTTWRVVVVGRLSGLGAHPALEFVAAASLSDVTPELLAGAHAVLVTEQEPDLMMMQVRSLRTRARGLPLLQALTAPDFESTRLGQAAGADYTLLWPQEVPQLPGLLAAYYQGQVPAAARRGVAFGLYSPRGGAGVATLAAMLATALRRREGKALLVDMDTAWGGLEALLQVTPRSNLLALRDLIQAGEVTPRDLGAVVTTHAAAHLLASPATGSTDPVYGDGDWVSLVDCVRAAYPCSVWSMAPEMCPTRAPGLWSALDEVLVVVSPAFTALMRTRHLARQLAGVKVAAGPRLGLVVNRDGTDPTCTSAELAGLMGLRLRGAVREDRRLQRMGMVPLLHETAVFGRHLSGAFLDVDRLAGSLLHDAAAAMKEAAGHA